MVTVKITDNETGRVLFEMDNAIGVLGVVANEDRADGISHYHADIPQLYTMLEVMEDMKQDILDDADMSKFAEFMLLHGGKVKINP